MKKNALALLILVIFLTQAKCAFSLTLEDLNSPKDFMNRLGTGEKTEPKKSLQKDDFLEEESSKAQIKKAQSEEKEEQKEASTKTTEEEAKNNDKANSSYADLSLKKLALDVASDLEIDEAKINSDLAILWAATTERSETMKYTIYKLANPDEDKPNDSMIKKIIRPIANMSSLAGASVSSNPFVAAGSLIGGGLFSAILKNDKEINYTFSKVSDADMVLLIRKIDMLQKKMVDLYVDYKTKEKLYNLESENLKKREEIFYNAQNKSKEEATIADVYYRNAKIKVQKAYDEFMTSRAILENLVGKSALAQIELS